jgi:phage shock protein C
MHKRLYRSETDRILGGVCGGLGEYLGINPLFVRIFFALWAILGSLSILIYFILWVVVPRKTDTEVFRPEDLGVRFHQLGMEISEIFHAPGPELITYAGVGLIVWGVYRLLIRFGFPWILSDYVGYFWPALLILAGIFVLLRTVIKPK